MRILRSPLLAPVFLLTFFYLGFVVYPFAATVLESIRTNGNFSLGNYGQLISPAGAGNWEAVWNSVVLSLLSVFFSGVVGVFLGFTFTQFDFPLKRLFSALAILPVALPPLVGVIAFMLVFGEGGIIPRGMQLLLGTEQVPFALDGMTAIVAVHVYSFYVYFYSFSSSALRQLDASVLDAAAGLGSTPWNAFRRVILPELRPALLGASILTFMTSMASFSAPFLLGGGKRFMTTQIYAAKLNGEIPLAAAQSTLLALASILFFLVLRSFERGPATRTSGKGVVRVGVLRVGRPARAAFIALSVALLVCGLLPILTIVIISFVKEGSWTWQLLPTSFTDENYMKLFAEPHVFQPILNSVLMSGVTLVPALALGVVAAYLVTKGLHGLVRRQVDALLTAPFAVPGTVVAVGLILAFNTPSLLTGNTVLIGTFWILPLAYLVRTYPLVVRSTAASLERFDDTLLEAAATFGASGLRRFRKIALPLIFPGIASGGLLCVIVAMGEFVSSILLYTYASRPISVEIFSQLRSYNFGGAAAYCVFLLVAITAMVAVADWLVRRVSKTPEGIRT